jgi:hypothetical protein
LILLAVV